jgi:hypothetical protein
MKTYIEKVVLGEQFQRQMWANIEKAFSRAGWALADLSDFDRKVIEAMYILGWGVGRGRGSL